MLLEVPAGGPSSFAWIFVLRHSSSRSHPYRVKKSLIGCGIALTIGRHNPSSPGTDAGSWRCGRRRACDGRTRHAWLRQRRSCHVLAKRTWSRRENGTLGTIEQVGAQSMTAHADDGRSVGFDLKDCSRIDHGYAATNPQGARLDRGPYPRAGDAGDGCPWQLCRPQRTRHATGRCATSRAPHPVPLVTEPNGLKSTRDSAHRWMKEWAQSYKSEGRAPVSHQKQRERNATKAIKPERKRRKINKAGR